MSRKCMHTLSACVCVFCWYAGMNGLWLWAFECVVDFVGKYGRHMNGVVLKCKNSDVIIITVFRIYWFAKYLFTFILLIMVIFQHNDCLYALLFMPANRSIFHRIRKVASVVHVAVHATHMRLYSNKQHAHTSTNWQTVYSITDTHGKAMPGPVTLDDFAQLPLRSCTSIKYSHVTRFYLFFSHTRTLLSVRAQMYAIHTITYWLWPQTRRSRENIHRQTGVDMSTIGTTDCVSLCFCVLVVCTHSLHSHVHFTWTLSGDIVRNHLDSLVRAMVIIIATVMIINSSRHSLGVPRLFVPSTYEWCVAYSNV